MRRSVSVLSAAAMAVTGSAASFVPAQAAMVTLSVMADAVAGAAILEVQNRRHWNRDWDDDRRWRRGRDWDDRRWRRYRDRDDDDIGLGIAAGIIGLAAGAILGGAAGGGSNYHAACSQKYNSYDPARGTYLGYDGYRHPCRLP